MVSCSRINRHRFILYTLEFFLNVNLKKYSDLAGGVGHCFRWVTATDLEGK